MIEYTRHIEEYLNYWYSNFSKLVPSDRWGNKKVAEEYLQKYWLSEQEYQTIWKRTQDKIFIHDSSLPDLVYLPEFDMLVLKGGCLFAEGDFKQLQKTMQELGEEYFVIIQHSQEFTEGEPLFRMKFPIKITWEELTSGNYISAVLFEMSYNEYFVFGESGAWGKYSANDYEHPLDIIGFKSEYALLFQSNFKQSDEEWKDIKTNLPNAYRRIIER